MGRPLETRMTADSGSDPTPRTPDARDLRAEEWLRSAHDRGWNIGDATYDAWLAAYDAVDEMWRNQA